MLAAGDTFRAGAIEQLEVWGERVGCDVIKQQAGADPAAVIYDAVQAASNRRCGCTSVRYGGTIAKQAEFDGRTEQNLSSHPARNSGCTA